MNEVKLFVAVKVCIINENNEVLLLRESGEYADGTHVAQYDIPGGRISPGEMLEDALIREVYEETGLTITDATLMDVYDTINEKRGEKWHIVRLLYAANYSGGEVVLSQDHDAYTWMKLREAVTSHEVIPGYTRVFEKMAQL